MDEIGDPAVESVDLLIVDGANVVGSRPDGWWRDRAGAAARLHTQLVDASPAERVILVLEGKARSGVPEALTGSVRVVHATGAGDDTIVAETAAALAEVAIVAVVTADRELISRVRRLGAQVLRPGWLLDRVHSGGPWRGPPP